jgi:hypothetical protein
MVMAVIASLLCSTIGPLSTLVVFLILENVGNAVKNLSIFITLTPSVSCTNKMFVKSTLMLMLIDFLSLD